MNLNFILTYDMYTVCQSLMNGFVERLFRPVGTSVRDSGRSEEVTAVERLT